MTTTQERTTTRTPVQPRLGPLGTLRFAWRQLTSMRTALFLLLLLAVAAVPGSILPQWGINAGQVSTYLRQHPTSGPWIDRLGGFDVFSSVWFSAIYLLLFVSLVGCVLPRSRQHWRALRARPPRTPARLERLPAHRTSEVAGSPDDVLELVRTALRRRHVRVAVSGSTLSAERGQVRETGNLVFHVSLVVLLVAVAAGHLLGWRGDVIVPVGATFSNAVPAYDALDPGPWVDTEKLPPFSVGVDSMTVRFQRDGSERGAPREFTARVTSRSELGAPARESRLGVNHPLVVDGAKVFLLGNGYAPVITVRDAGGTVLYSQATPFIPVDGNYQSTGVVKVAGAEPDQIGLAGLFLPTASTAGGMPRSIFPDALNPTLVLTAYVGDLSTSPSVYALDESAMTQLKAPDGKPFRVLLGAGQTIQLPDGKGSVTFDRVERFAGLSIRHDPGKAWALAAAIAAMIGLALSLFVPRRRIFVRVRPLVASGAGTAGTAGTAWAAGTAGTGRTLVEVGAISRNEDTGLDGEIARVLRSAGARDPDGTDSTDHRSTNPDFTDPDFTDEEHL